MSAAPKAISGNDERLDINTGKPLAMASSTGNPNPSYNRWVNKPASTRKKHWQIGLRYIPKIAQPALPLGLLDTVMNVSLRHPEPPTSTRG